LFDCFLSNFSDYFCFILYLSYLFSAPFYRPPTFSDKAQTFFLGRQHFSAGRQHFFIGRQHFSAGRQHFLLGRQHFSAGRQHFFLGRQHFSARREHFLTGRKHFRLSARIWRKVFKIRLFSKQSV